MKRVLTFLKLKRRFRWFIRSENLFLPFFSSAKRTDVESGHEDIIDFRERLSAERRWFFFFSPPEHGAGKSVVSSLGFSLSTLRAWKEDLSLWNQCSGLFLRPLPWLRLCDAKLCSVPENSWALDEKMRREIDFCVDLVCVESYALASWCWSMVSLYKRLSVKVYLVTSAADFMTTWRHSTLFWISPFCWLYLMILFGFFSFLVFQLRFRQKSCHHIPRV